MSIRGALFDVGGPIDTEVVYERLVDEHIREALAAHGIRITAKQYTQAERWAVDSFAPNVYQAIIWYLVDRNKTLARNVYHAVNARSQERTIARNGFELRPGITNLLASLVQHGLILGLAANQPASTLTQLERLGLEHYFTYREVSGSLGLRKPDLRVFIRACIGLGVEPAECVMIGDRIDNDIAPANALGMSTILMRVGRHRHQQPRTWEEVPGAEITDVEHLQALVLRFMTASVGQVAKLDEEMG